MSAPVSLDDPFGRATSGSTAFRMTTYDIVKEAFAICKIGIEGEEFADERYVNGKRSLNIMLTGWQAQGIHIHSYEEGTLFLESGKNSYTLEQVNATNYYTLTQVSADVLSGATTVTINSTELKEDQEQVDYLDANWFIGFLKADNTLFWTTVVSVAGDDVTITDPLPEDFLTGCYVVFYRDKLASVERVLSDSVRRVGSFFSAGISNETPVTTVAHKDFFALPNKNSQGLASQSYYHRKLPEGVFWVWQTPANSLEPINFTYERKIENFISADDCADWPTYWYEAIVYNLANRLGLKYRIPAQLKAEIEGIANQALASALEFDDENEDFTISIGG